LITFTETALFLSIFLLPYVCYSRFIFKTKTADVTVFRKCNFDRCSALRTIRDQFESAVRTYDILISSEIIAARTYLLLNLFHEKTINDRVKKSLKKGRVQGVIRLICGSYFIIKSDCFGVGCSIKFRFQAFA